MFKDHYTKVRFISFLKNKSDVVEALRDLLAKVKNDGHVIKELLSDNGGEFDNEEVRRMLHANGITQRLTAPYTPQQTGVAERENRTRMWANAQRDGRPAEHRWRPLFNAAKFG